MRLSGLLILLCLSGPAVAADWHGDVGAAAVAQPDFLGANKQQVLLLPVVSIFYGDRLQIDLDDGVRWTAFSLGPLKAGPIVEYRFSYTHNLPAGFPHTRDAIEPGLFTTLTTPVGILEGRVRKAVTGYRGWSGDVSADTELPMRVPGRIGLEARLAWADRAFARSRFGVDAAVAAASGLPLYRPPPYLAAGGGASWRLPLPHRLALTVSVGADRLLDHAADSPIVRTPWLVQSGVALTWHFGR